MDSTETYDEYVDRMAPHYTKCDPVPAGSIITCTNDHEIADVLETIYAGDLNYDKKIGNWRQLEKSPAGEVQPRCECGAPWFSGLPWIRVHLRHCGWGSPQLDIDIAERVR